MRNLARFAVYGAIIALMCNVCIVTLAVIFKELESVEDFVSPNRIFGLSANGWLILIVIAVLMARKIVRTVMG